MNKKTPGQQAIHEAVLAFTKIMQHEIKHAFAIFGRELNKEATASDIPTAEVLQLVEVAIARTLNKFGKPHDHHLREFL